MTYLDAAISFSHPFNVRKHVVKLSCPKWMHIIKEVLLLLGNTHTLLILDYPDQKIVEILNKEVNTYPLLRTINKTPTFLSLPQTVDLFYSLLDGKRNFYTEEACIYAAAAIYLSNIEKDWKKAYQLAEDALFSGGAKEKFESFRHFAKELIAIG